MFTDCRWIQKWTFININPFLLSNSYLITINPSSNIKRKGKIHYRRSVLSATPPGGQEQIGHAPNEIKNVQSLKCGSFERYAIFCLSHAGVWSDVVYFRVCAQRYWSRSSFNNDVQSFTIRLKNRGHPDRGFEKRISEVIFSRSERSLTNKEMAHQKISPM